jgi:hypothetical protein
VPPSALFQSLNDRGHVCGQFAVDLDEVSYLAPRVQNGGMIAATKTAPDHGKAVPREDAAKVHCDLARPRILATPAAVTAAHDNIGLVEPAR